MERDSSVAPSPRRRQGFSRDQVQLVKRKYSARYEIVPIEDSLSFEEGFYAVIHACQLLSQKNHGLILVGVAGPSGAGKSIFTEKILKVMHSFAIINMDNYNDDTRVNDGNFDGMFNYDDDTPVIDGNFDDSRLTDFETLLDDIYCLKDGKSVQVPIYDFMSNSRIGYRTLEVPSSRIVILEGINALSEKLRPLLDLRVSVTGGVHFDLVKRVFWDIQRAGQEPGEIVQKIYETVYPMYKAFTESDLKTAHIKIQNKLNPFSGFHNHAYILKSRKAVRPEQIKTVLSEDFKERTEESYDIYLLPPGEDAEACQLYLRMRNRDGKYSLMFEEWVTDGKFIISPRIHFEVSVSLLRGLMALGYTIATILKRKSHIFDDDKVTVKTDWLEKLNRTYVQVRGKDRSFVENVANQLGLEGSYVPHTYIEEIPLERLVNDVTVLPDDLKTKLSLEDDTVYSRQEAFSRASADNSKMKYLHGGVSKSYFPNQRHTALTSLAVNNRMLDAIREPASPATLPNQGDITELVNQISALNKRMDDITPHIEKLNSNIPNRRIAASESHLSLSQIVRQAAPLLKQIAREQRLIMIQLDVLSKNYFGEGSGRNTTNSRTQNLEHSTVPALLAFAIGCVGMLAYSLK